MQSMMISIHLDRCCHQLTAKVTHIFIDEIHEHLSCFLDSNSIQQHPTASNSHTALNSVVVVDYGRFRSAKCYLMQTFLSYVVVWCQHFQDATICYPFVCLRRSADCDLLLLLLRRAAEFESIDGATTKLNAKN